jgi:hypothetical protein
MGLPDIDGDGRGDLGVSAPRHRLGPSLPYAGRVYVLSGASHELLYTVDSPYSPHGGFGSGLCVGPDLNGDGFREFVTGDPNESVEGQASAGRGYVFSSLDGRLLREFHSPHPRDNGSFGVSVAFLSHAGPGAPSIAFGATGDQDGAPLLLGRVYLFESCPSDFDYSGSVSSVDFFDFLNAFFGHAEGADFNADGLINSQDFFDFLSAFFAGC